MSKEPNSTVIKCAFSNDTLRLYPNGEHVVMSIFEPRSGYARVGLRLDELRALADALAALIDHYEYKLVHTYADPDYALENEIERRRLAKEDGL